MYEVNAYEIGSGELEKLYGDFMKKKGFPEFAEQSISELELPIIDDEYLDYGNLTLTFNVKPEVPSEYVMDLFAGKYGDGTCLVEHILCWMCAEDLIPSGFYIHNSLM